MRDLVYQVDKWTSYLWRRLLQASPVIRGHIDKGKERVSTFDALAREVFARLYTSPQLIERTRPEDAWAKKLHETLSELPSFTSLAAHCAHNKELASAATATVLEQLVEQLPDQQAPIDDPEARRREIRGLIDFRNSLAPSDPGQADLDASTQRATAAGKSAVAAMQAFGAALDAGALRQALRRTVDEAATELQDVVAAAAGVSGLGGAGTMSEATQAALFRLMKQSDALRRLGALAGRMRRLAMAKRRARTRHSASELTDITSGNDLARLLPHELLKLTDPLLSLDFFRAFLERSLLQYKLSGNEKQGRGPLVVLVDDSDSMDGAKATFARAAALALADLALTDRRTVRLVRFSHKLNGVIDLRPGADQLPSLLDFLSGPVDGGTDFERALQSAREAIEQEARYEQADVVLITDGEADISGEFMSEWHRRANAEGVTTYALHIGGQAPRVLRRLTNDVIELPELVPEKMEETLFSAI